MLKEPPVAGPEVTNPESQVELVHIFTVELASALPVSNGLLLLAGGTGLEDKVLGAPGAVESSTNCTLAVEHPCELLVMSDDLA